MLNLGYFITRVPFGWVIYVSDMLQFSFQHWSLRMPLTMLIPNIKGKILATPRVFTPQLHPFLIGRRGRSKGSPQMTP